MDQHSPGTSVAQHADTATQVHCVELVFRTSRAEARPLAPIHAARILGLLPAIWRSDIRVAVGEIAILVARGDGITMESVRREASAVLADPALRAWQLVECRDATYLQQ